VGEDAIRDDVRDERMTVADAAERLGITKEAVRKRVSRRTLRSDKDPDGTVWVYIPASGTPSGTAAATFKRDELIAELRARIEDLRTDRDAWRDQARRSDYMASAALDRTRELESRLRELEAPAAPEPRQAPETVEAEQELGTERARHQMAESTMREGMDEERWRREEAERERDDLRRELLALRRRQRESPQTAPEAPEGSEPRSYAPGAQDATQRPQGGGLRGLRRRILGW
jgi:hypothetical protein